MRKIYKAIRAATNITTAKANLAQDLCSVFANGFANELGDIGSLTRGYKNLNASLVVIMPKVGASDNYLVTLIKVLSEIASNANLEKILKFSH